MAYSRRFYFFDKDVLKDPLTKEPFDELKEVRVTCSSSGRGYLWFGDVTGVVCRFDRMLKQTAFKAYDGSIHLCCQMKQHDILVTVGHDEIPEDKIKVWNVSKWDGNGMPFCSRIVRATPQGMPETPVTCLEVMENLNYMVVGHENGLLQLFKGDVTRERHSKRRVLHECPRAITGLGLQSQGSNLVVYVTTEGSIMSILIGPKDKEDKTILDQFGCPPKCALMMDSGKDANFVVGYKDAIYFYTFDGRGPCLAIEGEKEMIHFYKNYLVIVKKGTKPGLASSSVVPKPLELAGGSGLFHVTVFDSTNKFIAGEYSVPDVQAVLSEWGGLYLYCGGGTNKIFHLIEKDTQSKLDLLFSKKNFNLAIEIAKSQHYDEDGLTDIFRRYADHLYKQKEYDAAIQEYIKTIGKLEASYVIQQFLDISRIHNLTAYLQALHKAQLATEDHTTLLLNCYTKLKDEDNLNKFITSDREVDFDVETAIRVLRQSGYNRQAVDLARRFHQHAWYLKIMVEDEHDYATALDYIGRLPFDDALKGICLHGNILMAENPTEAARVLEKLCACQEATKMNVNHFLKIFVNNREGLMHFLERYIKMTGSQDIVEGVVDTLLELYLYELSTMQDKSQQGELKRKVMDILKNEALPYNRMKALMLCHQRAFKAGYLHLCEVNNDFEQMIRYHMESNDYDRVLQTCRKFGDKCTDLWIEALSYFSGKSDCEKMIQEVIDHIDQHNLISPLMVVQRLADGGKDACKLGVVKDYLLRRLQAGQQQMEADQEAIKKFRSETEENRTIVRKLTTKPKIFQMQKCIVCHQSLDPPSVHFLCDHSYHMQCFQSYTDNENECPACAPENRQILAEVSKWKSQRLTGSGMEPGVLAQVGFAAMGDLLARGIMSSGPPTPRSPESATLVDDREAVVSDQSQQPGVAPGQFQKPTVAPGQFQKPAVASGQKPSVPPKPAQATSSGDKWSSAAAITSGFFSQMKGLTSRNQSQNSLPDLSPTAPVSSGRRSDSPALANQITRPEKPNSPLVSRAHLSANDNRELSSSLPSQQGPPKNPFSEGSPASSLPPANPFENEEEPNYPDELNPFG